MDAGHNRDDEGRSSSLKSTRQQVVEEIVKEAEEHVTPEAGQQDEEIQKLMQESEKKDSCWRKRFTRRG